MKPQRGKTPRKFPRQNSQPKDPVEVYCRIRPPDDPNIETCVKLLDERTVQISPSENSQAYKNGVYKETQYAFKYVFDEYVSQKAVFDTVASPLVEDLLRGKNGLMFTYGVTGSGKTYTMTGKPSDPGTLVRSLDMIFNSISSVQAKKYVFMPDKMNGYDVQTEADAMVERQKRDVMPRFDAPRTPATPKNSKKTEFGDAPRITDPSRVNDIEEDNNYAVFVSYIEIYNNYIYDLLEELPYDPITGYRAPNSKILREDGDRSMYVSNCTEVEVKSAEEAFDVLLKGQKRRKVAHTALNTESSRSHSVFNIRLVQAPLDPLGEEVLQDKSRVCSSQLALVDLAGSERLVRTNNVGDRLREAGNINQSLMALRACMDALRENQLLGANKMVPYRDSKLTHLFKNYFDGEGKVRMIVTVNPAAKEYDETVQVMRFAEVTQEVQVARPQQVQFDYGLAKGRRRMNQQYKEAMTKMGEEGSTSQKTLAYSMGPSFPALQLLDPSDESVIVPLIQFLAEREMRRNTLITDLNSKSRIHAQSLLDPSDESVIVPLIQFLAEREMRRNTLITDLNSKFDQFRAQLLKTEKENMDLRHRNDELENLLGKRDNSFERVEKKLRSLQKSHDQLERKNTQFENMKRELETELNEKDWKILREKSERERMKSEFKSKMVLTQQHMEDQLEKEKRKIEEEAEAQLWQRERTLQALKSIIDSNEIDTPTQPPAKAPRRGPAVAPKPRYMTSTIASRVQTKSDQDLRYTGRTPKPATRSGRTYGPKATERRAPSPPPKGSQPVYNPKAHRRSKSSHEVWLEHKPAGTIELDTVLQPNLRKKKSVSKLEVKDTMTASKYILQHQEQASDGEMQTKLYKANVVPTAGGGASVVFNDVETLRQISPGTRKRRSPQPKAEDFEGQWTDTEDRCAVALEGHATKRSKFSGV
ncbi:kinesin-like protein KIF23 [Lingula anatina]|uniref:Kinesin-like protein n=1 Tax=Lingula anatina TaxID=7574 RepID=A0A2R2MKN5_LINAN|nr:kinesin-like protein KIF23 [Lingula anatina]|eukprot:XP_023930763.1 kinesin-like protein KIF23 [Lingula anatina]